MGVLIQRRRGIRLAKTIVVRKYQTVAGVIGIHPPGHGQLSQIADALDALRPHLGSGSSIAARMAMMQSPPAARST
ncbi:MAG: hypothetical protein WDM80_07785 [Limisphaerales bacterium]